jgi:hypothetical protein
VKKGIILILPVILITVALFFLNTSLENYKNTYLVETSKIETILKKLEYKEYLGSIKTNENGITINYDMESYEYHNLEKNSAILFYLINDLKETNFIIADETINFKKEDILKIFKKLSLKGIEVRYKGKNFEKMYLGNINGKYDVFDYSDICLQNKVEIYQDEEFTYYASCTSAENLHVVSKEKNYNLTEALEEKIITITDLEQVRLTIIKEGAE